MVLARAEDDLVVDVRDVDLVDHVVAEVVLHDAAQDVERQVRARVAHVAGVVHRRAAGVPEDLIAARRPEVLHGPRQRVVHAQAPEHASAARGVLGREPRRVLAPLALHGWQNSMLPKKPAAAGGGGCCCCMAPPPESGGAAALIMLYGLRWWW